MYSKQQIPLITFLKQLTDKVIRPVLFGKEYEYLHTLSYLWSRWDEVSENKKNYYLDGLQSSYASDQSKWKNFFDEIEFDIDDTSEFILLDKEAFWITVVIKAQAKSILPQADEWLPEKDYIHRNDNKFPPTAIKRSDLWSANETLPNVYCSSGPLSAGAFVTFGASDTPTANDTEAEHVERFVRFLFEDICHVLSVASKKDSLYDYKKFQGKKYQVSYDDQHSVLKITHGRQIRYVSYHEMPIEDNHPLCLTFDQLGVFSQLNTHIKRDKLAIHCVSGVGRTGLVAACYQLLQDETINFEFGRLFNKALKGEGIFSLELSKLACLIRKALYMLRAQRYTVQDESQLIAVIINMTLYKFYPLMFNLKTGEREALMEPFYSAFRQTLVESLLNDHPAFCETTPLDFIQDSFASYFKVDPLFALYLLNKSLGEGAVPEHLRNFSYAVIEQHIQTAINSPRLMGADCDYFLYLLNYSLSIKLFTGTRYLKISTKIEDLKKLLDEVSECRAQLITQQLIKHDEIIPHLLSFFGNQSLNAFSRVNKQLHRSCKSRLAELSAELLEGEGAENYNKLMMPPAETPLYSGTFLKIVVLSVPAIDNKQASNFELVTRYQGLEYKPTMRNSLVHRTTIKSDFCRLEVWYPDQRFSIDDILEGTDAVILICQLAKSAAEFKYQREYIEELRAKLPDSQFCIADSYDADIAIEERLKFAVSVQSLYFNLSVDETAKIQKMFSTVVTVVCQNLWTISRKRLDEFEGESEEVKKESCCVQ